VFSTENMHAKTEIDPAPPVLDMLAAPDRSPADRALDAKRQAAEVMTFLAAPVGGRVAELACGGGYWTELVARAVGPSGVVYGENSPTMLLRQRGILATWNERLARPIDAKVVRLDRELGDPLPHDVRGLDLVYLALDYHQLAAHGVDRGAMNRAVLRALQSGGRYVVMDETPVEGPFVANLHELHSEESRNARREIEAAGFAFASEGRFFHDSSDPREWDVSPPPPTQKRDRFILTFTKP
jgi:predicted methyltransferase